MRPCELLEKMQLYSGKPAYQLGCTAKTTLNVYAQQQRAFNLIWALHQSELIGIGKSVGIIGGGIAGISAAVAATAAGATVCIYEKTASIMHLQAGNQTRFLHPNIALWPDPSFGFPLTELPFMNWRAESAGNVAAQCFRQWNSFERQYRAKVELRLEREVEAVSWSENGGQKVLLRIRGLAEPVPYDVLIVAAGYGIESPTISNTDSYWRNDDLAQPALDSTARKNYLVSGTGDGGLIDVLRLTLADFHHQRFIQAVMHDSLLISQGKAIEEELKKSGDASTVWMKFIRSCQNMADSATFLRAVRKDTKVWLNATQEYPSRTKAQLLQRLCVALLIRKKIIEYIPGRLVSVFANAAKEKIALIRAESGDTYLPVDHVIERHDSTATFPKLFPDDPDMLERVTKHWNTTSGTTWHRHHPASYLADALKGSHLEKSYMLGFMLLEKTKSEVRRLVEYCFSRLGYYGPCFCPKEVLEWFGGIDLSGTRPNSVTVNLGSSLGGSQQMTLAVESCFITQFAGGDPTSVPASACSVRIFAPGDVNQPSDGSLVITPTRRACLCLRTESRQIVDELLETDDRKYHLFRTYLSDDLDEYLKENFASASDDKIPELTPLVSFDTHVFLVSGIDEGRSYIESQCYSGMLLAHLLLRAPVAIEVLLNRWPTTRVHGLGWAILRGRNAIRTEHDGNLLLQWNPTRYCD